ncbi:hypothetical protein SESBI_31957 [Sesbania bispinosa]|nr:hypothetical protein SESBI_31957 [Sesbania bispinosa]
MEKQRLCVGQSWRSRMMEYCLWCEGGGREMGGVDKMIADIVGGGNAIVGRFMMVEVEHEEEGHVEFEDGFL